VSKWEQRPPVLHSASAPHGLPSLHGLPTVASGKVVEPDAHSAVHTATQTRTVNDSARRGAKPPPGAKPPHT
jgi:hypothetical protein